MELKIDPLTSGVTLLNYVVVNDCGRVINPMTAEARSTAAGLARRSSPPARSRATSTRYGERRRVHGIGNAIFEWMGYDENAQPSTTNFAGYLLPSTPEISPIGVHLAEYPSTKNSLGVKGIGESGTAPAAPAIISGIEDALSEYGMRIDETPVSPARIFELVRKKATAHPSGLQPASVIP